MPDRSTCGSKSLLLQRLVWGIHAFAKVIIRLVYIHVSTIVATQTQVVLKESTQEGSRALMGLASPFPKPLPQDAREPGARSR